ncbi:hypothetical protein ACIA8K_40970 [Catenuloplanes sp. NPDC051500]|uniref:hypothetical protein n=1 Tax=Catenuloplanes sp. NPDC051500 TaxID=3363959 RepID=UPI0037A46FE5
MAMQDVIPERGHLRFPDSVAGRLALGIGVAGVLLRGVLLLLDVPPTNSDEATMGLAGAHIAAGADLPIWFYGQAYMGTIEAYLAAPLFALFGSGTLLLRLPLLLGYAAFLFLMYRLTVRLFTPGLAVVTVGLLALGADRVIKNEMIAGGGYPEMLPAAAGLMLLALWLADGGHRPLPRAAGYATFGLVTGLALWVDLLILPYLGVAGIVLLVGCHSELRGWAGAVFAGATVLGALPLIWYNLNAPPGLDSWSVHNALSAPSDAALVTQLKGGVLIGLPLATGLCAPGNCARPLWLWGPLYLALLAAAVILALIGWYRARGGDRLPYLARLGLLAAAAATLAAYLRSGGPSLDAYESARYLHCLLVSIPAVLWPLWRAGRLRTARLASVAVVVAAAVLATGQLLATVPRYHERAEEHRDLVATLERLGITRVYSEYWTCNRISFDTRERIVCAVLTPGMTPGMDRLPTFGDQVRAAAAPAYAFPTGSPTDAAFAQRLTATAISATVTETRGYRIYQPVTAVPLP